MLRKILVLLLIYMVFTVIDGAKLNELAAPLVTAQVLMYLELRAIRKEKGSEDKGSIFQEYM